MDESLSASNPVTGESQMQVAWSAEEDSGSATISQPAGMVIEQKYTSWHGQLNPRWMRNWSILRHHLFGIVKKGHRPWPLIIRIIVLIILLGSMVDLALTMLSALIGVPELHSLFGVSRDNLYGHVMGFFPRNILFYPVVAALLVGGMISEDRQHGTSALYFSRPITRFDYVMMKFLSVFLILFIIVDGTLALYYMGEIIAMGHGWSWIVDTFDQFLIAAIGGVLLCFTYTCIGLALSSVSRGRFFPGIALLAVIIGTKTVAAIVESLFDRSILYLISPHDCLAHITQALIGTTQTYSHPWTWSLFSLLTMNAVAVWVLTTRVASMEVTRE